MTAKDKIDQSILKPAINKVGRVSIYSGGIDTIMSVWTKCIVLFFKEPLPIGLKSIYRWLGLTLAGE